MFPRCGRVRPRAIKWRLPGVYLLRFSRDKKYQALHAQLQFRVPERGSLGTRLELDSALPAIHIRVPGEPGNEATGTTSNLDNFRIVLVDGQADECLW